MSVGEGVPAGPGASAPVVSVVVINVDGLTYLQRCVESVRRNRYPGWEIIVVDNGSRDGSQDWVRGLGADDPRLRLIALPENVGPAKARNIGAAAARGHILAFLDNDTVVDAGWLLPLVAMFDADPSIGAIQCKLLLEAERHRIDYVGDYLGQFGFLIQRSPIGATDAGQCDQRVEVFSAKSAGMAIRRRAFVDAGGFDEDYFIYVEETDLAWRVWLQGYRVVFAPDSVVYHAFGTSSVILGRRQRRLLRFHGTKNYISTLVKNLGPAAAWRIVPLHVLLWLGYAAYLAATGEPRQAGFLLEGVWWCARHARSLLAKRAAVQARRTRGDREVFRHVLRRRSLGYFIGKATNFAYFGNAAGAPSPPSRDDVTTTAMPGPRAGAAVGGDMPAPRTRYAVGIASHVWAAGAAQALAEYLRRRHLPHLFVGHPFHRSPPEPSYCLQTSADGATRRSSALLLPIPEPYRYVVDFLVTLRWFLRLGPVDVFVGCGNLNAFAGLLLRRLGRAHVVVFYAIDHVPLRFRQRLLNAAYQRIERLCLRQSDLVWNVSPAMAEARAEEGLPPAVCARQVVVPIGGGFDLARRSRPAGDSATIAFVGHLLEKQGLQVALRALPEVRRALPEARLLVIGSGPYEPELRALMERLGLRAFVRFTGRLDSPRAIHDLLATGAVGIAPYLRELDTFTRFADPGKIKDYLACGLPVVTTDVPPIAPLLVRRGAGIIVEPTPAALAAALLAILRDPARRRAMAAAAAHLGLEYDWERVFDAAFAEVGPARAGEGRRPPCTPAADR